LSSVAKEDCRGMAKANNKMMMIRIKQELVGKAINANFFVMTSFKPKRILALTVKLIQHKKPFNLGLNGF
jgi:hypothetical protein